MKEEEPKEIIKEKILKEIAYDVDLEDQFTKIKEQIWFNEELQIQPKSQRNDIFKLIRKIIFDLE